MLPQWPQTTLIPWGWMGSAGWAGCSSGITITGLRLIMRLLLDATQARMGVRKVSGDYRKPWICLIEVDQHGVRASKIEINSLAAAYQFGRGHPILLDVSLQMSRQLQGHLTYFFPVGGFLMGWENNEQHKTKLTTTLTQNIKKSCGRGEQLI